MTLFTRQPKPTTPRPEPTPFEAAAREWDRRTGDAASAIRSWRIATAAAAGALIVSLGLVWFQTTQHTVQTYVVAVDPAGRPAEVRLASPDYRPTQAQIGVMLADWIQMVRSKSTDSVVLVRNWQRAYHYLTQNAANALTQYANEHNPLDHVGTEARSIEILSALQRSPDTYQVQWREETFLNGARQSQETWTALFTVVVNPPRDSQQAFANPLGLYIASFSWGREPA